MAHQDAFRLQVVGPKIADAVAMCQAIFPEDGVTLDSFCSYPGNRFAIFNEEKTRVIGVILYRKIDSWNILIDILAVRPEFRRLGIGTAILQQLIQCAIKNRYLILKTWVRESNTDAQLFLTERTFRKVYEKPDMYPTKGKKECGYLFQYLID